MKVSDAMVEAALLAYEQKWNSSFNHEFATRVAIEAAIAAWVKPTRAESARARWEAMTPEQRKQHTAAGTKGIIEKSELRKIELAREILRKIDNATSAD